MRPMEAARAVLLGEDHTIYGDVAVEAVTSRIAVGITRGRLPKPYRHVDDNEDVVAAVAGDRAVLLVVADGHNGLHAPAVALQCVLDRLGGDPPAADLDDDELIDLFHAAGEAVLDRTDALPWPHRESRTTLALALVAGSAVQWASMGDSAIFVATVDEGRPGAGGRRAASAHELTQPRNHFVGWPMSPAQVAERLQRGRAELDDDAWLVLATDGFSNFTGGAPPAHVVAAVLADGEEPQTAARALIDHAGDAGAGDNIAVALLAPAQTGGPA
jgi:serine/threonine protein phosphatase PrpC